jgi:AcrR family transcriptional regulator
LYEVKENLVIDRREQRRLETRRRLIDAAKRVFSAKGYQDAAILDITEAADVSKRTFYLHFNDKQAIIEALALTEFQALRDQIEAEDGRHNEHESFRAGFSRIATMIFEYAQQNADMMQIIFGEGGSFRLQAMVRDFTARSFEENMLRKCFWNENAPLPPAILGHAVAGVINQLLHWWVRNEHDYTPGDMAAMCASVLFDNIEANFDLEKKAATLRGDLPMEAMN